MARCLSWSFFPSFEMTAGRAGRGESERRTFGWRGKRRTVCEEYIKKGEMVGAGDVEEVVGAGLAEGGPIDEPSFAGAAGGECHKTIFGMMITYWCELDQKSVAICARHGTKSDCWGLGGRDDAEDASGLDFRTAPSSLSSKRASTRPTHFPYLPPSRHPRSLVKTLTTVAMFPRAAARSLAANSRTFSSSAARQSKVTVLGAGGGIGQPLSLLLKLNPHVTELSLYDIRGAPGVAADVSHIDTKSEVSLTRPLFLLRVTRSQPSCAV